MKLKGINLIIQILLPLSLGLFIFAGINNHATSLSGHHMTVYDPLLYACVLAIYTLMWDIAKVAVDRDKVLNKIFGVRLRLKHALRFAAGFFGGVIIFGVNNHSELAFGVEIYHLHLVFTALAILMGYAIVMLYPDDKKERIISYFLLLFGIVGFGAGFLFDLYSVTWAEFLVALPITYTMYKILNKGKKQLNT